MRVEGAAGALLILLEDLQEPRIALFVALLACKTFISNAVREATSYAEQRYSASRCLRDVGLPPESVPRMLLAASRFYRNIMKFNLEDLHCHDDEMYYDEGISFERRHKNLLDHLRHLDSVNLGRHSVDPDDAELYYQFCVCSALVVRFRMDKVRPLRLFSTQDSNRLFSEGGGINMSSMIQVGTVRKQRYQLIRKAAEGAVSCIHHTAPGELDLKEYT